MLTMLALAATVAVTPSPSPQTVARVLATVVSGVAVRGPRTDARDLPRVVVTRERRCEPPAACRLIVTDLP